MKVRVEPMKVCADSREYTRCVGTTESDEVGLRGDGGTHLLVGIDKVRVLDVVLKLECASILETDHLDPCVGRTINRYSQR